MCIYIYIYIMYNNNNLYFEFHNAAIGLHV